MTSGDRSQIPIERLAQALLEHVRQDVALLQRPPANDDDLHLANAMLPATRPVPQVPTGLLRPVSLKDTPELEALEELISLALTSAHEAEDVARETQDATRRTRRGMIAALAFGVIGIAIAAGSAIDLRLASKADSGQMLAISSQVQSLGDMQNRIHNQLASLQAQSAQSAVAQAAAAQPNETAAAAEPASVADAAAAAEPAPPGQATVPAAAMSAAPAMPVRVLPAHTAVPVTPPVPTTQPAQVHPSQVSYVPEVPMTEHARAVRPRRVAYHHHQWRAENRSQVVLPWPAIYLMSVVSRDARQLFH